MKHGHEGILLAGLVVLGTISMGAQERPGARPPDDVRRQPPASFGPEIRQSPSVVVPFPRVADHRSWSAWFWSSGPADWVLVLVIGVVGLAVVRRLRRIGERGPR